MYATHEVSTRTRCSNIEGDRFSWVTILVAGPEVGRPVRGVVYFIPRGGRGPSVWYRGSGRDTKVSWVLWCDIYSFCTTRRRDVKIRLNLATDVVLLFSLTFRHL